MLARGAADDAKRVRAAEFQPLHHGDKGIALAAGCIDARLVSGHALDANRFGHRDPRVAYPGDRGCGLLGKAGSIVRLRRRRSDQADDHEGRGLKTACFIAVGENEGRTLTDYNAVRTLHQLGSWTGEALDIVYNANEPDEPGNGGCAVLVQRDGAGPIIAAAMLKFAPGS